MKQRDVDFLFGLLILVLVVLQIVFLTLKLTGVGSIAEWGWFAVMTPTAIPAMIVGMVLAISWVIILSFRK